MILSYIQDILKKTVVSEDIPTTLEDVMKQNGKSDEEIASFCETLWKKLAASHEKSRLQLRKYSSQMVRLCQTIHIFLMFWKPNC